MIIGIGIDLINVERIERIIFRWKDNFLRRVYTDNEIKYCNNKTDPSGRFTTRLAAKEAFKKALFPKGDYGISYKDIEVANKDNRVIINLYGEAKKYAAKIGVKNIHVMTSHDGDYGIANVVIEG